MDCHPNVTCRLHRSKNFVVELIGPWSVKVNVRLVEYKVLTIIDTVTNLVELIRTDCKEVTQVRANFV